MSQMRPQGGIDLKVLACEHCGSERLGKPTEFIMVTGQVDGILEELGMVCFCEVCGKATPIQAS